jgi:hypothetical protein
MRAESLSVISARPLGNKAMLHGMASPDAITVAPSAAVTAGTVTAGVAAVVSDELETVVTGADTVVAVGGGGVVSVLTSVGILARVTDASEAHPTIAITPITMTATIVTTRDEDRRGLTETHSLRGTTTTLVAVAVSFLSRRAK